MEPSVLCGIRSVSVRTAKRRMKISPNRAGPILNEHTAQAMPYSNQVKFSLSAAFPSPSNARNRFLPSVLPKARLRAIQRGERHLLPVSELASPDMSDGKGRLLRRPQLVAQRGTPDRSSKVSRSISGRGIQSTSLSPFSLGFLQLILA